MLPREGEVCGRQNGDSAGRPTLPAADFEDVGEEAGARAGFH